MVREKTRGTRITVDLGSQRLARALRVLAAAQGRPLRDVVDEALRDWIGKQEELEDIAAIEEAKENPQFVSLREALGEWGE
jgi:hypothetical protein